MYEKLAITTCRRLLRSQGINPALVSGSAAVAQLQLLAARKPGLLVSHWLNHATGDQLDLLRAAWSNSRPRRNQHPNYPRLRGK